MAPGMETSVVKSVLLPAQIVVLKPEAATVNAEDGEGLVPMTAFPTLETQEGLVGFRTHIGYVAAANPENTFDDCHVPSKPVVLLLLNS